MPLLPDSWSQFDTASRLLQEKRGVETWEWQGPEGHRLLKVHCQNETLFREEFEFLSSLEHPGLPRATNYERHSKGELYAREFIAGRALSDCFGKLSGTEIAQYFAQSLRALAALHHRGLAHGDLSASNIVLHPERGAVLIDLEFLSPRHRKTPSLRGTPRCMAPELFWGRPPTIQTDLYALGCILYALLSGRYPFLAEDFESLLQQHALEIPPDPTTGRPELPRGLGLIALRLLAKEGLLESHRGVKGGYGLTRRAQEITVGSIITALEGPIAITTCTTDSQGACEHEPLCPVRSHWHLINLAVRQALDSVTLADMASHPRRIQLPIAGHVSAPCAPSAE